MTSLGLGHTPLVVVVVGVGIIRVNVIMILSSQYDDIDIIYPYILIVV